MGCCGNNSALFYPTLPTGGSSPGQVIENGRLVRRRRNAYYSTHLQRASEVIQHPGQIRFREFCILLWAIYASYTLYFSAHAAWQLLAVLEMRVVCGWGQTFMGCSQLMFWEMMHMLYTYLAQVVPWAILCAGVAFVGEEAIRKRAS